MSGRSPAGPTRESPLVSAISELRLREQQHQLRRCRSAPLRACTMCMREIKTPCQRPLLDWWQVLGSNQRRRCRQIYRPPDKPMLTRVNGPDLRFQGTNRARTAVDTRRTSTSTRHPHRDGRDARELTSDVDVATTDDSLGYRQQYRTNCIW